MKPKASDVQSAATAPAIAQQPAAPTRQAIQAKTRSKSNAVTGALAIAVKAIIEEGLELDAAASRAGITTRGLRVALERPHVITWMKAQREVFRAYVCAQNIHHAKKMRDTSGNAMAQLGAMKLIEQIGDDAPASSTQSAPGMVIVVVNQVPGVTTSATIEHKPMQIIDNATGLNRE